MASTSKIIANLGSSIIRFTELVGTDYSPQSVEMCKRLAKVKGHEDIRFVVRHTRQAGQSCILKNTCKTVV